MVEEYPDYQVTITGHSLGGALAILYGAYVATNVLPNANVLVQTLGTPRVGDQTFKSSLRNIPNLSNWRLVYRLDVVPRIPLETQNFVHAGQEKSHAKVNIGIVLSFGNLESLY